MTARRIGTLAILIGLIGLVGGCDKKPTDTKRARVSGKITLDTRALPTGTIVFDPGNGEPPASLDILDGSYEGKAMIGKNKVTITSMEKVSMKEKMKMDGPGYDQMVEINRLPPRYNTKSEITREVEDSDSNVFNFDIKSSEK